ncbi:MAG TPA: MBL fold metallo-hydrolase [Acidimicrobiales bacterium]
MGAFPINAFLLSDGEPMLVDTGSAQEVDEFVSAVDQVVGLNELRWIYLTHCDHDHVGALGQLLEQAPNARVALTFPTMGFMATGPDPIPRERASMVTLGEQVTLGGRQITPLRPPTYDNGGTAGFLDHGTGIYYCVDFLGAVLPSMEDAVADDIATVAHEDFAAGATRWASLDAPWVHAADRVKFDDSLSAVQDLQASALFPTHGPPIRATLSRALDVLRGLPGSEPPKQRGRAEIEATLAHLLGDQTESTPA